MALTDNLIVYYKLDEASGNALDAHSVGPYDLTDTNTVTSTTGKISNARSFASGSSEYFTRASNANLQTGDIDFTVACWLKLTATGTTRAAAGKFGGSDVEWLLRYHATPNTFYLTVFSGGSYGEVASSNFGTPAAGTWYHVVAWHDSVNNQIGIAVNDGTPNTLSFSAGAAAGTGAFEIGRYAGLSAQYWDGAIDELGFWKRVLTSGERTSLYNGGSGLAYSSFGGGGATVAIGLASEADATQTFTRLKRKSLGQNSEADLAQLFTRLKRKSLGLNAETDTTQPPAHAKQKTLGLDTETDLAQTVRRNPKAALLGLNAEADAGQAFAHKKSKSVGLDAEVDAPNTWTRLKRRALGLNAETDVAQTITSSSTLIVQIGLNAEADAANPWSSRKARALGLTSEIDAAPQASAVSRYPFGPAGETDAVTAFAHPKRKTLGLQVEDDSALHFGSAVAVAFGQAAEGDSSPAFVRHKTRGFGSVADTETAPPLGRVKLLSLGLGTEADETNGIRSVILVPFGAVIETDSAAALARSKTRGVGLAAETDQPFSVVWTGFDAIVAGLHLAVGMSSSAFLTVGMSDDTIVIVEMSTMGVEVNTYCFYGEKVTITFTDVDQADWSGQSLVCELRSGSYSGDVILRKTVGDGVSFPVGSWPTGSKARVVFKGSETRLTPGPYYLTLSDPDAGDPDEDPDPTLLAYGVHQIKAPRVGS